MDGIVDQPRATPCGYCRRSSAEGHAANCWPTNVAMIVGFTTVGPARVRRVDLAARRIVEWQTAGKPPTGDERGGSSSPREINERKEDRAVSKQAVSDQRRFSELCLLFAQGVHGHDLAHATRVPASLESIARRLAALVARYTVPVDHGALDENTPTGCVSCARKNAKKGLAGHWEPISAQPRYAYRQLCTWCGRYAEANRGAWPPIEVVDMRARQGEQAAGRWLARQKKHRKTGRK